MHGGAKTLTIMSESGSDWLQQRLATSVHSALQGLTLVSDAGNLPLLLEKREGALQAAINAFSIQILAKSDWDVKKNALGSRIYH